MIIEKRKINFVILAAFLVVGISFIFSRLRFLDVPLDRDEGTYLYTGYCFIRGYVPYVDFYEIKPPGIFLVYGLFELIFGASLTLLHLGVLVMQLATCLMIYKISLRFFGDINRAFLSVAIYMIFNLFPNFQGFGVLSEHFFIFFVLLSMYWLQMVKKDTFKKYSLYAGLSLGMAAMIRQHAIFFIIPLLLYLIYIARTEKLNLKSLIIYYVFGNLIMIMSLTMYILLRGGLDEMIYWVFTKPSEQYLIKVTMAEGMVYLTNFLKNILYEKHWPMLILLFVGLIECFRNIFYRQTRWTAVILLLFFIGSFATVFPGLRFYGHYWLMFLPALALVSGNAYLNFESKLIKHSVALLIGVLFITQLTMNSGLYFKTNPNQIYQRLYGNNPNFALQKITEYLNRKLKQSDEIFVFGSEPQVYYETQKVLKIPHIYVGFMHVPSKNSKKWQEETIGFLKNSPPEYLVHIQNSISINMKDNSLHILYNWIFGFESSNYTPVAMADIDNNNVPTYFFDKDARLNPKNNNYIILYKLNH
ncbi:MAG: glycosyltransferase family 39 protein [Saprospiraceae bacterium]|nr:glycosyltransferase family 39 protein [Saprospiraceae bacterium]